jgi:hypothetical protein
MISPRLTSQPAGSQRALSQRSKAMRLALIVPWVAFATFLLSFRLNGIWLKLLVAGFVVAIVAMVIYVAMQIVKMKRGAR